MHAVYDPWARRLRQLDITDHTGGERLDRFEVDPGDLVIADRGYGTRGGLAFVAAQHADFIVRIGWHNVPLEDLNGKRLDLLAALRTTPDVGLLDLSCQLRSERHRGLPVVRCRLVAVRKTPVKAAEARERAMTEARKAGRKVDPRTLEACGYVFVLTSTSRQRLDAEQVLVLYRLRWQIELEFKRLKSIMRLDEIRAKTPATIRATIAAKLLGALLVEELAALNQGIAGGWTMAQEMHETVRTAVLGTKAAMNWLSSRATQPAAPPKAQRTRQRAKSQATQCQATWALAS